MKSNNIIYEWYVIEGCDNYIINEVIINNYQLIKGAISSHNYNNCTTQSL